MANKTLLIILFILLKNNGSADPNTVQNNPVEENKFNPIRIFSRGEKGYELFRIPTLVKAQDGTLLVFSEARKLASAGDKGDIDLVLKRSTDKGKTWSDLIILWDENENTCGNPVPVVDERTGVVHLLMTMNNRQIFTTRSYDQGLSWEYPKEITSSIKPTNYGFYATGPTHGIQIKNGPHKGRLVVPAYADIRIGNTIKHHSFCLISDDQGESWTRGGHSPQKNVGECTVVELSNGRLMLNMRSKLPYRSVTYSDDGGNTWHSDWQDKSLIDPPCQATLLDITTDDKLYILFSNPASTKRENVSIKTSMDEGNTWHKSLTIYKGPSAYSDMTQLDSEDLGLVFESGVKSPHGNIYFTRVPLSKLL